jgi:hypothetical protein
MNNIITPGPKISLMITSHNRPKILSKSLKYILKAEMIDNCNIVIVQQNVNSEFKKIFNKINHKNFYLIKTSYPNYFHPHKKITLNGRKGLKFCFEKLNSDICFYLEDDIAISYDFITFGSFILNKYKNDANFFAVNSFSKEKFNYNKINLYSKFIYGIGKGWGVNKNKWPVIKTLWNNKFILSHNRPLFEIPIEEHIKKKRLFVVMPINSRSFEIPSNGVNINLKNDFKYFKYFRSSFVKKKYNNLNYSYSFFSNYKWRNDCIKYKGKLIHFITDLFYKLFKNIYLLVR